MNFNLIKKGLLQNRELVTQQLLRYDRATVSNSECPFCFGRGSSPASCHDAGVKRYFSKNVLLIFHNKLYLSD